MPRFFCATALSSGAQIDLPPNAARHVQVLRLQPGDELTLFDGRGGEYSASVLHMGRSDVRVQVGPHADVERECAQVVHLAVGMPSNERMDWLVEKATELGVASITPLMTERSVLRLAGERADKKQAHWQAIAVAAAEQCGRNRVPAVHSVQSLASWLPTAQQAGPPAPHCCLLSLRPASSSLSAPTPAGAAVIFLSGPEGGLSRAEEDAALAAGFTPVNLGPRVLRAETAPLAALVALTLRS